MRSVGLLPAIPLIAGTALGIASTVDARTLVWLLALLHGAALVSWWRRRDRACVVTIATAFLAAGGALGAQARAGALDPSLRVVLDRAIGGVLIGSLGPEGDHDPIGVRARLVEDASALGDYASLRVEVLALSLDGSWQRVEGGMRLSVGGAAFLARVGQWRAGRVIEAPVTFRRPARYLNDGVADFERDAALSGTALLGSIKSGLLVEVVSLGTAMEEWGGRVRAHVRRAVERRVSHRDALSGMLAGTPPGTPSSTLSGALVTAVLIGDRAGLPDQVRERLQQAGTYHVIAISGGNIAILAGLGLGLLMVIGIRGRLAAVVTIAGLMLYAQVVTAGPSVWRATAMAVIYLIARAIDHRVPPWQATALAAALMAVVQPLDVRDAGFVLTFGATAALLEGVRRVARVRAAGQRPGWSPGWESVSWVVTSLAASASVEAVLLPVSAQMFSRVTFAGLLLNLLAVPLMGIVQIAGLMVSAFPSFDRLASPSGWVAHAAASGLVGSARLMDVAPWLSFRVPPPGAAALATYYGAAGWLLLGRRRTGRACAAAMMGMAAAVIVTGWSPLSGLSPKPDAGSLRLTMFDVGQAESMLLELPGGPALLVDTGGAPFGDTLDIGVRVLAPALWARGHRSVDGVVITHGDPDHLGGATTVIEEFRPQWLWEGIVVPGHAPMAEVRDAATVGGSRIDAIRAGRDVTFGGTRIRILHPPEPDWERPRVRNDDSVVLEVLYGDVAILLTGDIGADIERAILPQLTPAATRVLKVAHHGSRTSSSAELLETWRPQIALISAGRGNSFGHPAPEVLRRLEAIGATVLRTDQHGQVSIETDGHAVRASGYVGGGR